MILQILHPKIYSNKFFNSLKILLIFMSFCHEKANFFRPLQVRIESFFSNKLYVTIDTCQAISVV